MYGKLLFIVLLIALNPVNAMGAGIGLKASFTGGPMFSVVGMAKLNDKFFLNLPIGGFPGIIMRVESNLRLSKASTEKRWSPYVQGGIGYTAIFRGRGAHKNIKDIHVNVGISKPFLSSFEFSTDIGLLYAPYFINPWMKEEFPDVTIPIVPMIGLEVIYKIK